MCATGVVIIIRKKNMIQVIKNLRTGKVHWLGVVDYWRKSSMCNNWAVGIFSDYISRKGTVDEVTCKICKRKLEKYVK